ncbi:MAG: hypothetical protein MUF71_11100 [Candidatus Kapabacteria bacterium]|jgi:hypothetical protein|nr:hypothetical protein [Candidatus Kapabacteria bacterium]
MKSFFIRFFALCVIAIGLVNSLNSCTVITTGSQTEAITRSGGWVFDSFSAGTPNANQQTAYTGMTVVFTSSGSVTFTPTAAGAAVVGKASATGTWSLASLEVISLNVPDLGLNGNYAIAELNATTFRYNTGTTGGLEFKWTAK